MARPRVVIFDAIETLFSLEPVADALDDLGCRDALDVWFARLLRDAFALSAAGGYATFPALAHGALRTVLADRDVEVADDEIDGVLAAFARLPAHDDVRPALSLVAERDIPVHVFTNGSREATEHLVDRNGLVDLVDRVTTVHDIGRWKPAPEAYVGALAAAGLAPEAAADAAFVAVHGWDVAGARRVGLRTGWCSRLEHHLSPPLGPADVTGDTLVDVVVGLLDVP